MPIPANELCLEVEEGTTGFSEYEAEIHRVHFYPSSGKREGTGESLLSISTRGHGMRMTVRQAEELRDYLDEWIKGRVL